MRVIVVPRRGKKVPLGVDMLAFYKQIIKGLQYKIETKWMSFTLLLIFRQQF